MQSSENGSTGVINRRARQRALAIGVVGDEEHREDPLAELKELLQTTGITTTSKLTQRHCSRNPSAIWAVGSWRSYSEMHLPATQT